MIARRFTPAELAALQPGQRVAHLTGGGTGYRPVTFEGVVKDSFGTPSSWCGIAWMQPGEFVESVQVGRRVRLSSLGPLQGAVEEAVS